MSTIQKPTVELGQSISKHALTFTQKWGGLGLAVLLICLGPVAYLGLTRMWAISGAGMQEVIGDTPIYQYLPLILGAVSLLAGVLYLFNVRRNWPLAVNLCERGMEYTDQRGTRQIAWEEVKELQQHIVRHYYLIIPVGTDYYSTVQLHGGEIITFDNRFSKIKKLGQVLQERLAAMQLPEYMADIQAGKRVEFGALSLDQEGVYQRDKVLKWDEVAQVALNDGTLSIVKKGSKWGSWAKVKTSEVPNAMLFYMIAQKLGGPR